MRSTIIIKLNTPDTEGGSLEISKFVRKLSEIAIVTFTDATVEIKVYQDD